MLTKTELRQALLLRRRQISDQERQLATEKAVTLFAATEIFQQSQHVGCYYPTAYEFNSLPFIQHLWAVRKHCYLPVLRADKQMDFVEYSPSTVLQRNRYNILEPMEHFIFATEKLDMIILPLVRFDRRGNRLGMGGGYYDRALGLLSPKSTRKSQLFGLAYALQEVSFIPADTWDVALDGVITEQQIIIF